MAPRRRIKGGDFGDVAQNAALIGVGAYAARNPDTPGMSIIANVGKFFLYGGLILISILILIFLYAIFFGKREKMTMQCRPDDVPETRDGEPGCRTGSGNWYRSNA